MGRYTTTFQYIQEQEMAVAGKSEDEQLRFYGIVVCDADKYFGAWEDMRTIQAHFLDKMDVLYWIVAADRCAESRPQDKRAIYDDVRAYLTSLHETGEHTEEQHMLAERCISKRIEESKGTFRMLE
jgi:hypothetical protein